MKTWSQDVTFDDVVVTDFTYFMTGVADREECAYHCATSTTCTSFFYAESEGRHHARPNTAIVVILIIANVILSGYSGFLPLCFGNVQPTKFEK
nr:hypothetical protein BaRGS_008307 [Batillaria attramentaria]